MKKITSTSLVHVPNMARLLHRCVATKDKKGAKLCRSAMSIAGLSPEDIEEVAAGNFKANEDYIIVRPLEDN